MIKHIFHCSDIHIPLKLYNNRYDEYLGVFTNFIRIVKSYRFKSDEAVIVIAGDLFDIKLSLDPELVHIAMHLMTKLSEIHKLVIITGNHDCNEKNVDRIDTIHALVNSTHNNIDYLRKSGVYDYGNIKFVVSSLVDKRFLVHRDIDKLAGSKYYCIYHGAIIGSKTNTGYAVTESDSGSTRYRKLDEFDGFDAVLLGDIHKFQRMRSNIAYSGSLLQVKRDEHPTKHGFLLWDTLTDTCKHVVVYNTHVKIDYDMDDPLSTLDKWSDKTHVDINMRTKVFHTTVEIDEKKKIVRDYMKDTKFDIKYVYSPGETKSKRVAETLAIQIKDSDIIKEILHDDILAEKVNNLYTTLFDPSDVSACEACDWSIQSFEFKNLGIYGNDILNKISIKEGVSNICAKNTAGKSTILNIILFCLFGKGVSMNSHKSAAECRIKLTINDNLYVIERVGKRNKKSKKVKWSTKLMKNGANSTDLTSAKTNKTIIDILGTFDYFCTHNIIDTKRNNLMSSMKRSERFRYFMDILGISKYDTHLRKVKEIIAVQKTSKSVLETTIRECEVFVKDLDCGLTKTKRGLGKAKQISNCREIKEYDGTIFKLDEKITSHVNVRNEILVTPSISRRDINTFNLSSDIVEYTGPLDIRKYKESIAYNKAVSVSVLSPDLVNNGDIDDLVEIYKKSYKHGVPSRRVKKPLEITDPRVNHPNESEMTSIVSNPRSYMKWKPYSPSVRCDMSSTDVAGRECTIDVLGDMLREYDTINEAMKSHAKLSRGVSTTGRTRSDYVSDTEVRPITKIPKRFIKSSGKSFNSGKVSVLLKTPNVLLDMIHAEDIQHNNTSELLYQSLVESISNGEDSICLSNCNDIRLAKASNSMREKEKMRHMVYHKFLESELADRLRVVSKSFTWLVDRQVARQDKIDEYVKYTKELDKYNKYLEQMSNKAVSDRLTKHVNYHIRSLCAYESFREKTKHSQYYKIQDCIDVLVSERDAARSERRMLVESNIRINEMLNEFKRSQEKADMYIKRIADKRTELNAVSEELDVHTQLYGVLNRNKLPAYKSRKYSSVFESRINEIFEKYTGHSISIDMNCNKCYIEMWVMNQTQDVSVLSGYETLMLNIAITQAFTRISSRRRCGFFAIDESIDCIDNSSFAPRVTCIVNAIRECFSSIYIISHRDIPRDLINYNIEIESNEAYSRII